MNERYHHQGVIPSVARDLYARRSVERCLSAAYGFLALLEMTTKEDPPAVLASLKTVLQTGVTAQQ